MGWTSREKTSKSPSNFKTIILCFGRFRLGFFCFRTQASALLDAMVQFLTLSFIIGHSRPVSNRLDQMIISISSWGGGGVKEGAVLGGEGAVLGGEGSILTD